MDTRRTPNGKPKRDGPAAKRLDYSTNPITSFYAIFWEGAQKRFNAEGIRERGLTF